MDDRGRLAQSVKGTARRRLGGSSAGSGFARAAHAAIQRALCLARLLDRWSPRLAVWLPRRIGVAATAALMLASVGYGAIKGGHVPILVGAVTETLDQLGNAAGFRIVSISLAGNRHVTREEVLAGAGITGTSSLLFLDVERVRERLRANPWIADAAVLKLYPGELQIAIRERVAFALWQKDRRLSVIADDGTVLEPYVAPALIELPLVVGAGAQGRAKEFLALLDRHPALRGFVRASVLVGERRWNLRLKNGIDVELPEHGVAPALETLVRVDHEKRLLSRDIASIDLRLPDQVTVRLSEAAAQARIELLKDKPRKKGGNA
ncbi:MAG TPA: cell division protein FtsQ/DivIB [Xanthobacteraceae bacterium]|jgi:cell division protein FtsQ